MVQPAIKQRKQLLPANSNVSLLARFRLFFLGFFEWRKWVFSNSDKNPHRRFEFAPEGSWQVGPEGITLNTGRHMHHQGCKHKHSSHATHHHHAKQHHHANHHHKKLWHHLTEEKADGLMTVTVLMYKGEGEQNFFVTPKEFEFSTLKAGEDGGHVVLKALHPVVEALSVSTHCKHPHSKDSKDSKDTKGGHLCPHVLTKSLSLGRFDKIWKSKAADSFGKDNPNGFVWADFGTHAVLMTVVIGAPHGDRIPLTIMDAHLVSDQGTQHITTDLDKSALAQLLVDSKKAKGTMMVDGDGMCPPYCF